MGNYGKPIIKNYEKGVLRYLKKEFESENPGTKYLVITKEDRMENIYGVFLRNELTMDRIESRLAEIPDKKKKHKTKKLVKE